MSLRPTRILNSSTSTADLPRTVGLMVCGRLVPASLPKCGNQPDQGPGCWAKFDANANPNPTPIRFGQMTLRTSELSPLKTVGCIAHQCAGLHAKQCCD